MSRPEIKFLFKHSSIYGLGTIAGQAVGFLLLPLYTRYLTPSDYGVAALIEISLGLAGLTIGAGLTEALARFYHDFHDDENRHMVVSTLYGMLFILIAALFPIFYLGAEGFSRLLFGVVTYAAYFQIAGTALLVGLTIDAGLLFFRLKAQSGRYVTISLLQLFLLVIFNVYFIVWAGSGLKGIFYSMLVSRIILTFLVTLPVLWKVGLHFSGKLALRMAFFSGPLVFSNTFRQAVAESDKYFINFFFSPFETGIYAIANKIGTAVHLLLTVPFLQTFVPRRFEIMHQENAQETYASIFNYYLLILGTAGVLLSFFAGEIIRLMTTEKYYEASHYVPLVILNWIIFGMRYHFETGIMIHKKTKYFAYINAYTAVITLGLNYFLIPRYKIWGALMALNISQLITTGSFYIISQRLYPVKFDLWYAVKMLMGFAILFLASLMVSVDNILVSISLKAAILLTYPFLIWVLGLMDSRDLDFLKRRMVGLKEAWFTHGSAK